MTKVLTIILASALLTACSESTPPIAPLPTTFRIDVSASTTSLALGDSVDVRAIAITADGSQFPLKAVGWTTSNNAIATVTPTGPLTAKVRTIGAGSVAITASFESHSGQLALAVSSPAPQPAPQVTQPWLAFIWSRETGMIALPFPPGAGGSNATAINDLGQVVGTYSMGAANHAFVWTLDGGMIDIRGLAEDVYINPAAINNAGQVAGGSIGASGHLNAFRWSPSEGMIVLPMPPGTEGSSARSINASGEVAGERSDAAGRLIPFRWSQEKGTEDLALFGSDSYGAATAIADNGDIVGYSGGSDSDKDVTRAVLWSANGTKQVLDDCTGGFTGWDYRYYCHSRAQAINSAGQVAGWSDASALAFRLTVGVNRQDLLDLPGTSASYARAINDAGAVVGYGARFLPQLGEVGRAFLWSPTTGTTDLGALPGRQWSIASGINNRGQVVGSSY